MNRQAFKELLILLSIIALIIILNEVLYHITGVHVLMDFVTPEK
jgi:hypothetical protein